MCFYFTIFVRKHIKSFHLCNGATMITIHMYKLYSLQETSESSSVSIILPEGKLTKGNKILDIN
jgi:hypothetical protein